MYATRVIVSLRLLALAACLPFAFPAGLCPCEWAKLAAGSTQSAPDDDCCPHDDPGDESPECPHCDHGAAFDETRPPGPVPAGTIELSLDFVPTSVRPVRTYSPAVSTSRVSTSAPSTPLFVTHCALVL